MTMSARASSGASRCLLRLVLQVERDTRLPPIEQREIRAVGAPARHVGAHLVADRWAFDLHHVGARFGQHQRGQRSGQQGGEVEDKKAGERRGHGSRLRAGGSFVSVSGTAGEGRRFGVAVRARTAGFMSQVGAGCQLNERSFGPRGSMVGHRPASRRTARRRSRVSMERTPGERTPGNEHTGRTGRRRRKRNREDRPHPARRAAADHEGGRPVAGQAAAGRFRPLGRHGAGAHRDHRPQQHDRRAHRTDLRGAVAAGGSHRGRTGAAWRRAPRRDLDATAELVAVHCAAPGGAAAGGGHQPGDADLPRARAGLHAAPGGIESAGHPPRVPRLPLRPHGRGDPPVPARAGACAGGGRRGRERVRAADRRRARRRCRGTRAVRRQPAHAGRRGGDPLHLRHDGRAQGGDAHVEHAVRERHALLSPASAWGRTIRS